MWYDRLKPSPRQRELFIGLGLAASVLATAWIIGAASRTPDQSAPSPAAGAKTPVHPPAVNAAAAQVPPAAPEPMTPDQLAVMEAKVDVSNPHPLFDDDQPPPVQAPPAAPEVAGVDAPTAAVPPPPQPMEVAMQTVEAPATTTASAPTQLTKVGYFARGAPSAQHLPIPSH